MATLTVGTGQEYLTIAEAVAASGSGDTIDVLSGTYTNDFLTIAHDLTLKAVGGTVKLVATEQPPNGKAYIDEGGSGVSVRIQGFDISGVTVPDGNGAAVRYEGGDLTLINDNMHDNQEGILGAPDPNGNITIDSSTFSNNGSGTGYTHNIYIGDIASLTVKNSTITSANVGHDIKSRAETTTIINNTITDGAGGTASYEIDLPNGGNATIKDNVIEKGENAQNPIAISFGEEGNVYANSSLTVTGNTILNDNTAHSTTAIKNATSVTATVEDNSLYGWTNTSSGPATLSNNVTLTAEPDLAALTTGSSTTGSGNDQTGDSPTAPITTNPTQNSPDPSTGMGTGTGTGSNNDGSGSTGAPTTLPISSDPATNINLADPVIVTATLWYTGSTDTTIATVGGMVSSPINGSTPTGVEVYDTFNGETADLGAASLTNFYPGTDMWQFTTGHLAAGVHNLSVVGMDEKGSTSAIVFLMAPVTVPGNSSATSLIPIS